MTKARTSYGTAINHPALRVGPILIADSDKKISYHMSVALEREGFKTIAAYDGSQAIRLAREHQPLFVILDVVLPVIDGWEVCRELRRASDLPILILTTRSTAAERVMGLKLGADDYVVKPCGAEELVARVKAILRRTRPDLLKNNPLLSHRELVLDIDKRKVTLRNHAVSLTPFEYKLLHVLMTVAGRVFLREELLNHLYPGGEAVIDRVIDVHIGNLRRKIEENPSHPRYILTARGIGYQFVEDDTSAQAEDKYQRLFENAMTGMYQTTLGGRYINADPMLAQMFGYQSSAEMIEDTVDLNQGFYVAHERRAEFVNLMRTFAGVREFESQVYRRDGSLMWITEHALAINDAAGEIIGFQGTTIDVTARKQEELALQKLDASSKASPDFYH